MAASRRGVAEEKMKRPAAARARRGGKLDRLRQAVQEFVQAAGGQPPLSLQKDSEKQNRRSRRDARKEKRRLKRSRRRRLRRGEPVEAPAAPAKAAAAKAAAAKAAAAKAAPAKPALAKPALAARPRAPAFPAAAAGKQRPGPPLPAPTPRAALPAAAIASARKRALLEANEEEEKEIRRLERRLGLGKRRKKQEGAAAEKLPQSFLRDGLGYVLGALGCRAGLSRLCESSDDEEEAPAVPREGRPAPEEDEEGPEEDEEGPEEDEEGPEEDEEGPEDASDPSEEGDVDGEWENESSSSSPEDGGAPEASEPPGEEEEEESLNHSAVRYVPPQVRKAQETLNDKKREELGRLKKMVNGLINRLSELNLSSISGQMEELYMANSRKDMNETLTDILMNACVTAVAMPARLMMEHVLLVSVLHHNVGIEVGAHFLEAVVKKFDELCKSDAEGKECENLLALIAHLYNFHVVHSLLIFDILKKLVSTFTEKEIELILFLLKNVGFSLRKDDALALKELITEAQRKANTADKKLQDQTRVRFMLDTMLALRNNDMRKIPGYDPEPVEKLRKLQRTLVRSSGSGKDTQLRVSLESLLSADQVGRWWIVGSSWSGAPMIDDTNSKTQQKLHIGKVSSKIMELARKQRMNTDIRRSIFCVLMTSEDFLDAFEKLLKLGLKDQQEREIVHVILYCCLQEKTYNPFYAFLADKFCKCERRFQVTFQFSIWDKIRDLENLSATAISNLVSLLAHLLRTKSLPLSVLKVIEFSELDKTKVRFLRQVLSMLLIKTDAEELSDIFVRLSDNPKLGMLREGLKLFLTHFLLKNVQAQKNTEEASLLKERVELATKALQAKESKLKL
ncbi:nucleolar MIF4G domain-containing protein 1 isoform X2 [Accipiter gentilis]|uniref:nucleolar MIF4G domain-containing protein 1 isoform X2 n=1 Tax=Astur gentilis TaxID=8957 RepID=UPI00211030BF|nr:nucleolar MIF4G domain-containing protein 1 isoform X2 [Accipiter gentilis]